MENCDRMKGSFSALSLIWEGPAAQDYCVPLQMFAYMHKSAHTASGSHFPSWQWHSMLRALKWIEGDYTLFRARSVIRSHYRLILNASPPRQQSFRAAEAERFGRFAAQMHLAIYRPHARTCTDWNHQQVYCRERCAHSYGICLAELHSSGLQ